MEYKNRIIAFIDILGFKGLIDSEKPLEIMKYINELQETEPSKFRIIDSKERLDERITYFSDCIVISYLPDEKDEEIFGHDFEQFISSIETLQFSMIFTHMQSVRGSICYGELIHTDQFCFGPGLVEAYLYESKKTHFPRIHISNKLVSFLAKIDDLDIELCENKELNFINPIKSFFNRTITPVGAKIHWNVETWFSFRTLISFIYKGLDSTDNGIREKYVYLAKSFNERLVIALERNPSEEFLMFPEKPEFKRKLESIVH